MARFFYFWGDVGKGLNGGGFSFCHASLPQHDKNICPPPSSVVFHLNCLCPGKLFGIFPTPTGAHFCRGKWHPNAPNITSTEMHRIPKSPHQCQGSEQGEKTPPEIQSKRWNRGPNTTDFASELCQAPPLVKDVPLPAVISSTQSSLRVGNVLRGVSCYFIRAARTSVAADLLILETASFNPAPHCWSPWTNSWKCAYSFVQSFGWIGHL